MGKGDLEELVREFLSKKSPEGYYVIPVPARSEAKSLLEKYSGVVVEEAGTLLFVKTRSRSMAEKILRKLYIRGLIGEY